MYICVNDQNEKPIRIHLPSGLILNRLSATIAAAALKEENVEISAESLNILFREIKKYKLTHPEWKLVEVHSDEGKSVEIIL